jgi:purine-nucleoside phosphorylase
MGVKTLVLTNAAGGVNTTFEPGILMLISDHINYSGANPLIGQNLDAFGPRFPDCSDIYTKELREKVKAVAAEAGMKIREGVYMMFSGPCYETPAEVRMARVLGADAVGMSTVPEAIVAAHSGLRVVGMSCITNMAAGVLDQKLDHSEVVETANRVHDEFHRLLNLILTVL